MRTHLFKMIAIAMLSGVTAFAGSFTSDFSNPNQTGFTLSDGITATGLVYPVIENGHLVLTFAEGSLQGSFVLDDLDGGSPIEGFTAKFKMQIGPGSGNPADGVSFNFGPDILPGSTWSEEGAGTGFVVIFDTYDNGSSEAPAIDIKVAGTIIAHAGLTKAELVKSEFVDVLIDVKRNGTLNMVYDGKVVYTNLVLTGWEPMAGQFGISARTGGETANQWIDDLDITTIKVTSGVAPTITQQPANVSLKELEAATFSVGFDGSSPITFQWSKNGVDIAGATSSSYTLSPALFADNGAKFKVKISNSAGSVTSQEASLTVAADTAALTVASVVGSADFQHITVTYSKQVTKASAEALANYSINGLTISAAVQDTANARRVLLTTTKQTAGTAYNLTINNVKDVTTGGVTIAANTIKPFTAFVYSTGFAVVEFFENMGFVADIPSLDRLRDTDTTLIPSRSLLNSSAETPTWENGSNQGCRMQGLFIAPVTGDYTFYIASDDYSYLYLSTDDTLANLSADPIAQVTGWTNQRDWLNTTGGVTDTSLNVSAPVRLVKDSKYYFKALAVEGGGGDGVAIGYALATAPETIIVPTGANIAAIVNPDNSVITITQQPASVQIDENKSTTLTVAATGSSDFGTTLLYQWQKNGVNIEGATRNTYTTPVLTVADSGTKYKVVISLPGKAVNSAEATVTVVTDSTPPAIQNVGALGSGTSIDVGVQFNEDVTEASAGATANYSLSSGTISKVTYYPKSRGAVLTVSGLTAGSQYTLTVKDVTDLKGNKMASTSKAFTVSGMKWGVVGAAELGAGNGVVAVGANGFDIYSDGMTEWGTYDEATFVYEEVTGDFDKKLRVEFQDNSSQWARAGLIVRDVLNFGVDRATQDGGAAGRYQKVHVNPTGPTLTGPGTAGNNAWEGNRRIDTGAATTSAGGGGNPLYPNAWCRLQRKGDLFTIYRSDDGKNWTQLGTTTFTTPMPAKLYVGPEYSPENGNITEETSRGMFVAKIRDYSDTFAIDSSKRDYAIGLNFGSDESAGSLAATDAAGVNGVTQANWNNIPGASGTNNNIVAVKQDNSTEATPVTVTFASNNTWASTGPRGEENSALTGTDKVLMTGYLDTGSATTTTVTISNIPQALTSGGYDVYVYALGGVAARGGGYRILDAASKAVLKDYLFVAGVTNPVTYVQAPVSTDPAKPGFGNYMIFAGLKAAAITIEATTAGGLGYSGTPRAPINAVQLVSPTTGVIVDSPECSVARSANGIVVTYTGTLESADAITGPWAVETGASPVTVPTTGKAKFYRAKK